MIDEDSTWYGGRPRPKRHCVRWGPNSALPKKGAEPPIFGPYLLWPNRCMNQDTTWCGEKPLPRPHCARWRPSSPSPKREHSAQIFGPRLLWPNSWMDQDVTWYEGRHRPRSHCVTWGPSCPSQKGHAPDFRPVSIVPKWSPISATAMASTAWFCIPLRSMVEVSQLVTYIRKLLLEVAPTTVALSTRQTTKIHNVVTCIHNIRQLVA